MTDEKFNDRCPACGEKGKPTATSYFARKCTNKSCRVTLFTRETKESKAFPEYIGENLDREECDSE